MLKLADLAVREDFSLGPLWVSPAVRLIKGPTGETHVEPLTMQVFLLLAEAKGQVVSRNRLYDECWGGVNVGDYSLNRTITMVRRIAAEVAPGAFRIESIPRTGYRLLMNGAPEAGHEPTARNWRSRAVLVAAAAAALGIGGVTWFVLRAVPDQPTVTIAASDGRSTELAGAIANATITRAATYDTPLALLEPTDGKSPTANFLLRVRKTSAGDTSQVDLNLISAPDKALLWSWSTTRPDAEAATLYQLAREIGALALTCAAETRPPGVDPPAQETVKLYLDACVKFEPWLAADAKLLPDAFEQVTMKAPQLGGAWSKLFLSKAEAIEGFPPIDMRDSLKRDIARSAASHVEVPEAYIARAAVLPLNARFERLGLYDVGLTRSPRNPYLLSARSWQLRSVGRMDEAARTAGRLVALYPQSPAANTEYVQSLMSSGRIEQARNVLEKAAKAAPDSPNLKSVRWRLEMRYGDPKIAMDMIRNGDWADEAMVSFLEARMNPTKANVDRAIDSFMAAYRADPREPGLVAQAMGAFGRTDEAIRFLLDYPLGANSGDAAEMLFRPPLRAVRRDPRFILIAQNFGVTDYWIKSGILPDFCYEPDLPYNCKEMLSRLRP